MPITVRQASISDVDTIAALFDMYRQFYGQAPDLATARVFIAERLSLLESVIFIALEDGEAVGFTQLYPSFSSVSAHRTWILNDLFVAPSARGKGAGRALLDAAKAHGEATGAKRLDLSTGRENTARRLYESQGYVRDEAFLHYSLRLD